MKELGYDGEIGRVWTYADRLHDAERLARALASRHAEGARVAVYANNVPEWVLLACFMGPAGSERPDDADLQAFVRARLAPQKSPQFWIWVDEWPLTGSGKIQKFKFCEAYEVGEFERQPI